MTALYGYLWALGPNWWWFMTSGPFLVEGLVKQVWSGYEAWADRYVSAQTRRKASTWFALFGVFVAGYLAFNDEHAKLQQFQNQLSQLQMQVQQVQGERDTAQRAFAGQQNNKARVVQHLTNYASQATDLLFATITKEQYPLWNEREEDFAEEVVAWVSNNLGDAAKTRLLDTSVFTIGVSPHPVVPEQQDKLFWLDKISHNLFALAQEAAASSASLPRSPP